MGKSRYQRGNSKIPKTNNNENASYPNLWDVAKAVLNREIYSHIKLLILTNLRDNKQPN